MKIGMISHWYDPEGGAAAGPGTIARALRERGHDVHVVTGFPIYPAGKVFDGYRIRPYQREVMDGVTVHRFPAYPSHDDRAAHRMANYLTFALSGSLGAAAVLRDVDVVFVYSTPATVGAAGILMRLVGRKRFVMQVQDLWPDTVITSGFVADEKRVGLMEKSLHTACNTVYRWADVVAVTSPTMGDLIHERGVPREKIEFIPNWAEERSFYPVAPDPSVRAELGLRPDAFVAMYAGNLGEQQSLGTLITAAEMLRDRDDIQIALVGAGVAEQRLRAQVAAAGLTNVVFCGPQPFSRMAHILAAGDVQVVTLKDVPLYRATLPSKTQANLAAGRPTIAAVAGDGGQLVRDAGGLAVRPGSAAELAAAIAQVADLSDAERQAMGERARAYYQAHYSEQVIGDALSDVLVRTAERGRTGRWPSASSTPTLTDGGQR